MCDESEADQLLGPLQAALDALNRIEDVQALMLKLESQNKKKLLKKVKSIASDVYGRASLIKETVSKAYKRSKVGEVNKEPSEVVEVNGTEEARYSPVLKRSKWLRGAGKATVEPAKAESSEAAAAPIRAAEPAAQRNTSTDIPLDAECSDIIESTPTASQEISNGIPETDPLEAPACATPKTPVLREDNSENSPEAQVGTNPQQADTINSIPKIKVVDINKLLAPKEDTEDSPTVKGRKSVTFDSSVVVLTSSDEDTPKKNPKEKDLSPLKSVLRKTASSLVIDLSDSDSKENNENLKNTRKTHVKQPVADKSSEESDSDHYSRSKRQRRQVKHMKSKFTELIERRRTRITQDNLSDEESTKDRKTPLKEKSAKKRKRREENESDGSSDEINQPDTMTALPDPKIHWKLYIPLRKFACEELPALYTKRKEVFQAAKNARQETGNRKLKLTLKLNKTHGAKGEASDQTTTVNQESEAYTGDKPERASAIEASAEANEAQTTSANENPDVDSTCTEQKSLIGQSDSEDDVVPQTPDEHPSQEAAEESQIGADTSKVASSDSDEDFAKLSKKFDLKFNKKVTKKLKKVLFSDSESGSDHAENKSEASDSEHEPEEESESESTSKQAARARIKKRGRDSSSDDDDKSTRKQIRKMIDRDELSETTRAAEEKEKQRKARIAEKQRKYNQFHETKTDATVDKVILDFDEDSEKSLLNVHESLVEQLKPHQVQGIKFMWDACFESLERARKGKGSGCILAHCMGLGKTLQVITLVHTLLTHQDKTKVKKVMVVSPVNTVLNWISEFKRWIPDNDEFEVYELVTCRTSAINQERSYTVKYWHENGGVLIIGYNMFRNLSNPDNKSISKKLRSVFQTGLVDPGPDLVVCDEGHLLKNEKTNLSIAMNRIKTARRIVLTGTPLQNNLREYWCMVQFIKPNLLGTYKEYMNRFVNPITNGQYTDSTQHDIMVMRRRSHVLHKLLDGVVQRQDYAVLEPYLPPKHEYVLFLKLSDLQTKLYRHYMDHFARRGDGSNRTSFLFTDFQELQRICTHPRVLLDKSMEDRDKKAIVDDESESEGSLKDFIDDSDGKTSSDGTTDSDDSCSDASIRSSGSIQRKKKKKRKGKSAPTRATRLTRAQAAQNHSDDELVLIEEESGPRQWWEEYVNKTELDNIEYGSKIFMLLQILKECEEIGDKVLVFSQSLYALNSIQYFLERIDEATQNGQTEKVSGYSGSWSIGLDYFRLDGSSSCDNRASWCDHFNNPQNTRARLFLISTKAGGLGINLVAANRVIIFDVSWNPSHDIQSIYRVYRFGQTKPTYIYRFVTYGAMEMKIYERQVTKQAISKRVIDEQQIDRHYSQNDIQELYKTDLDPDERPIPLVPKDVLLGEMLQVHDNVIYKYHEHQSLLENKQDEQLNEEERKAAWDEFENEKIIRKTTVTNFAALNLANQANALNLSPQMIQMALANMVRKDNPNWTQMQIKNILPGLVAQLQIQLSENNFSLYHKVQQELRMMQMMQAQRMHENMLKQYQMQQLLQNQQVANQLLGNLHITPEELRHIQLAQAASQGFPQPGRSNEIIDLNN
uniref:Transcriptional regulator ATRX homolog n=1 Tax=Dendroctonus ponderosae TaxID=77166 RepID=A0AAR5Q2L7_DENPD